MSAVVHSGPRPHGLILDYKCVSHSPEELAKIDQWTSRVASSDSSSTPLRSLVLLLIAARGESALLAGGDEMMVKPTQIVTANPEDDPRPSRATRRGSGRSRFRYSQRFVRNGVAASSILAISSESLA